MALTKFTNCYITLAEAEIIMTGNCKWQSLTTLEKEAMITNASFFLDSMMKFAGEKVAPLQPMEFPRDFYDAGESIFQLTEQTRRLKIATYFQMCAFLIDKYIGESMPIDAARPRQIPAAVIDGNARLSLSMYVYDKEVANVCY